MRYHCLLMVSCCALLCAPELLHAEALQRGRRNVSPRGTTTPRPFLGRGELTTEPACAVTVLSGLDFGGVTWTDKPDQVHTVRVDPATGAISMDPNTAQEGLGHKVGLVAIAARSAPAITISMLPPAQLLAAGQGVQGVTLTPHWAISPASTAGFRAVEGDSHQVNMRVARPSRVFARLGGQVQFVPDALGATGDFRSRWTIRALCQ